MGPQLIHDDFYTDCQTTNSASLQMIKYSHSYTNIHMFAVIRTPGELIISLLASLNSKGKWRKESSCWYARSLASRTILANGNTYMLSTCLIYGVCS